MKKGKGPDLVKRTVRRLLLKTHRIKQSKMLSTILKLPCHYYSVRKD